MTSPGKAGDRVGVNRRGPPIENCAHCGGKRGWFLGICKDRSLSADLPCEGGVGDNKREAYSHTLGKGKAKRLCFASDNDSIRIDGPVNVLTSTVVLDMVRNNGVGQKFPVNG